MKIMMIPGFSWAKSVGPKLPKLADGSCPQWCPATHFGYQTQGTCKIKFEDGTETTINAGDSYLVDKPRLPVRKTKFYCAFLHAIDATPAR